MLFNDFKFILKNLDSLDLEDEGGAASMSYKRQILDLLLQLNGRKIWKISYIFCIF